METQSTITKQTKQSKSSRGRASPDKKEILIASARALTFGAFSLLLGTKEMLFSTTPLTFALLAAATTDTPYVLLGTLLSSFYGGGFSPQKAVGAFLLVALRILARVFLDKNELKSPKSRENKGFLSKFPPISAIFTEHTYLRMMSAAVGVFAVGLWNVIEGGFRFYDLFGTIFYLVLTPTATLIYSWYFNVAAEKRKKGRAFEITPQNERLYLVSCALLICSLVFSLGEARVAGISVPVLVGSFATLCFCKRSALYGTVSGLLFGIACSPAYAPMLALCAVAYSSVSKLSHFGAGIAACIAGLTWGIYAEGLGALGTVFPALLTSSMLFCTAERISFFDDVERFFVKEEKSAPKIEANSLIAEQRILTQDEKLRSISDSFTALSEIFYNLSSKLKRPTMLDLRTICEESFEKSCLDCANREICFGAEYGATLDVMKKMTVQLHNFGMIDDKKLPDTFKKRCDKSNKIVDSANRDCGIATKKAFQNEKTEIFALDYDAIAKILNDAIAENEDEFKTDTSLAKRISKAITEEGYGEKDVLVYGKRKLKILARGLDLSDESAGVDTLMKRLEDITELSLCDPTFDLSLGSINMYTEARRAFSAESAFVTSASKGEKICGDTVSIFENKNDYLYALISDGMGTGNHAALASEMCNVFLRNMLDAGNKMETSLRMLNSVLRAKGSKSELECSATVDLLQLDLYSGMLTLVKSGAAPTFVIRRSNVFKLTSQSFPIGILRAIDAKQIDLACEDGDIIIMVSDGALKQNDDCSYLTDMLKDQKISNESAQKIADRVMRRVRAESDIPSDDLSVIALRIKKEIYKW